MIARLEEQKLLQQQQSECLLPILVPQASQGTRVEGYPADHLGCLHRAGRERRRVLSRGCLQRWVVHRYRNILSHVPSTKMREIAAMLKAIHASEDLAAAREKAIRVIEKLRGLRLSRAAELVETAVEETLTYYAFPEEHWR